MAGGIDWFRWHHGTVTDQKFPLIAKRAGASVAEAVAVWACLLEVASMNDKERGMLDAVPDFESMDCALGMVDGRAQAIFTEMRNRGLLGDGLEVTAWPRRQLKRERDDDASTARVQAFRERQLHETPRNAVDSTETPREEKRREEEKEKEEKKEKPPAAPWLTTSELEADGLSEEVAAAWIAHRKAKKAKLTPLAWRGFKAEALKAGWGVEAAVLKAIARNWTAFEAAWVDKPGQPSTGDPPLTFRQRDELAAIERVREMTGGRVHAKPSFPARNPDVLQEVFDEKDTVRRLG